MADRAGARRAVRLLAERPDLVGVALHRVGGAAKPDRQERTRRLAVALGRGPEVGPLLQRADEPRAARVRDRLIEESLAGAPFAVVVVDRAGTADDGPALVGAVGAALGRRLVAVDDPAAVPTLAPPPVAPLTDAERDLLAVAAGPAAGVGDAWVRWRSGASLEDWPGLARIGAQIDDALGARPTAEPDRALLRGIQRRARYGQQILGATAVDLVASLDAAGVDPVLVGSLAWRPPTPGTVRWANRVEIAVSPDSADRARDALERRGWTRASRRGDFVPERDHVTFHSARGIRVRVMTDPIPRRGARRFVPGRTRSGHLGTPVTVLDPVGDLVRHWARSAGRAERVSSVCGTHDRLGDIRGSDLDAALAAAVRLGVAGTAHLHLGALGVLTTP